MRVPTGAVSNDRNHCCQPDLVGEAAAHVQVATYGERPKAVAVVSGDSLNSPSTWRTQRAATMIGFIIFAIFVLFLGKAILETIWGTCLIIFGIGCHIVAAFLDGLALLLTGFYRLKRAISH